MDTTLPFTMLLLLASCLLVAAWPLLWLPRVRPLLAGAAGSSCVLLGSAAIGLVASGLVPLPATSLQALADDEPPAATTAESPAAAAVESPAADSSASGSGAKAHPPAAQQGESASASEPATSEPATSDPVIESPQDTVVVPPGRPAWIDAEPDTSGPVHAIPVSSGPYARDLDAKKALDKALVSAVNEYIAEQLGSELAPRFLRYDARQIKKRFVDSEQRYDDVATYSVGPMHEHFVLLKLDAEFRQELDARWDQVRATSRLGQLGLFAGAGLLLIASIFSYFRLDNATRGYYTGRLQFMTAAAILAIVGGSAILAQWIHWL